MREAPAPRTTAQEAHRDRAFVVGKDGDHTLEVRPIRGGGGMFEWRLFRGRFVQGTPIAQGEAKDVKTARREGEQALANGGAHEAHDSHAPGAACGCEPFTVVSKDPVKFKICTDRANKIGKLNTPRKIYAFMAPDVVNKPYEEFYVLGLGAHGEFEGKLITYAKVAQGGQHKVNVETEEIARILLADRPDIYILSHNHPSGKAEPSDGDIALTESVKVALKKSCPNIVFGDHLILAPGEFYSFRANGGKGKLFKVDAEPVHVNAANETRRRCAVKAVSKYSGPPADANYIEVRFPTREDAIAFAIEGEKQQLDSMTNILDFIDACGKYYSISIDTFEIMMNIVAERHFKCDATVLKTVY